MKHRAYFIKDVPMRVLDKKVDDLIDRLIVSGCTHFYWHYDGNGYDVEYDDNTDD